MQGIDRAYVETAIGAVCQAYRVFMQSTAENVLRGVPYGKVDTLGLDAIPEIAIAEAVKNFDATCLLVTEEQDAIRKAEWPAHIPPSFHPVMFFCDPTDASRQFKNFLEKVSKNRAKVKVGEILAEDGAIESWEKIVGKPASVTGSTASIACIKKGKILFSVILNYITRTIFITTPISVSSFEIPPYNDPGLDEISLDKIVHEGSPLLFPLFTTKNLDAGIRFVTFTDKSGYIENLNDSDLFQSDWRESLYFDKPPGPSRILYLSSLQSVISPIDFILANGEKIGEWIHWLAFAKYAKTIDGERSLRVFEMSLPRPHIKNGILMSTPAPYSIFCMENDGSFIDLGRLRNFTTPSLYRGMIVVTSNDNVRVISMMHENGYREISDCF